MEDGRRRTDGPFHPLLSPIRLVGGCWRVEEQNTPVPLLRQRSGVRQPALTDFERPLVACALEELGEAFTIGQLYEAFKEEISRR